MGNAELQNSEIRFYKRSFSSRLHSRDMGASVIQIARRGTSMDKPWIPKDFLHVWGMEYYMDCYNQEHRARRSVDGHVKQEDSEIVHRGMQEAIHKRQKKFRQKRPSRVPKIQREIRINGQTWLVETVR